MSLFHGRDCNRQIYLITNIETKERGSLFISPHLMSHLTASHVHAWLSETPVSTTKVSTKSYKQVYSLETINPEIFSSNFF